MREETIKKIRGIIDIDELYDLQAEIEEKIQADPETKILLAKTQNEFNELKSNSEYATCDFERGKPTRIFYNSKYAGIISEILKRKKELR